MKGTKVKRNERTGNKRNYFNSTRRYNYRFAYFSRCKHKYVDRPKWNIK